MSAVSPQRYHPPFLQTPEIVIYLICRIESSYPDERATFINTFCNRFIDRINHYTQNNQQQKSNDIVTKNKQYYNDDDVYHFVTNAPFHKVLCLFAPYIIHNRFMSPYKDVTDAFYKLIQYINKKLNISIPHSIVPYPMSGFLELPSIKLPYQLSIADNNNDDDDDNNNDNNNNNNNDDNESMTNGSSFHELPFNEQLFSMFGRINHFVLLLSLHKEYLSDFIDLFHSLMYENNGPLAQEKRQYLGLMAASRYECKPIIMQTEVLYAKLNGDITWIKSGINSAPQKYKKLAKINAILAHQPWLITSQHIADLVNGNGAWTISELVQSFVILIMYHFLCGMYHGLCITPEIDQYYASTLQAMQSKDDEILTNVLDNILSPVAATSQKQTEIIETTQEIDSTIDAIQKDITTSLQIDNNNDNDNDKNDELKSDIIDNTDNDEDEEDEEEDQRSQAIATLLSHTQQQLLQDEDIVGVKKKGFEQSACLNLDLDSVSESHLPDEASRSCFIKFRQLSDSVDDDIHDNDNNDNDVNDNDDSFIHSSLSMEFDPNMAPPSLSNHSLRADAESSGSKEKVQIESISKEHKNNDIDNDKIYKLVDSLDSVSSIPSTKKPHELTSTNWKQLILLRKQNMFPTISTTSEPQKSVNGNMIYYESKEQKLAKITNPSKNGKNNNNNNNNKKRKYPKIIAPTCAGRIYWKYSLGVDQTYSDFDCHIIGAINHIYDFNWDKHGYACLSRYYPGIEKKMDAVFKRAYTMTDHSINNANNLDTEPFRIAVWHYTFRLYGVNNDSYEYRFVNVYLPVKLKIFIKKLVCYPQMVTIDDVKKMGVALKEKEKIHIAILALEAKKQASLLFALKAVMKYMQSN